MLAFLESLCGALSARDADAIRRLLGHPLALALPRLVREEAKAIASGQARGIVAPLHAMHFYHQTAHLLGVCSDSAVRRDEAPKRGAQQIELPLKRATA